jgi:hypothetical protein
MYLESKDWTFGNQNVFQGYSEPKPTVKDREPSKKVVLLSIMRG